MRRCEGWRDYLYGNPAPANALIKRDNPEMTDGLIAQAIAKMKSYGIAGPASEKGAHLGEMTDAHWKQFFDTMVSERLYPEDAGLQEGVYGCANNLPPPCGEVEARSASGGRHASPSRQAGNHRARSSQHRPMPTLLVKLRELKQIGYHFRRQSPFDVRSRFRRTQANWSSN